MPSGTIVCLCGAISLPLTNPLPGTTELCHCNPCRHTTGALFAGWVGPLEKPPDEHSLSKCAVYHSSKTHKRYFCSMCGTKVLVHAHTRPDGSPREEWFAFGGAIDPQPEIDNVLNVEWHYWLADVADGGMAPFMTRLGGREIPCYTYEGDSTQIDTSDVEKMIGTSNSEPQPPSDQTLKAECRCGGIALRIQQANHSDTSIPQLDRFIPKDSNGNATNKHMAFCCVCRSCRLQSGVSLTPWTYIPQVQILNAHTGRAVVQHRELGTAAAEEANEGLELTHYWSSDRACRSFCKVCGASAFYSTDSRPEVVNVAAGLLRADEGAMARRWLSWQWGRTPWKDETTQRDVSDAWMGTASS